MAKSKSYAPPATAEMKRWQTQEDMHTLARAAEIRADPKRLKAAQDMAKEKLMELAQVAGTTAAAKT